MAQVTKLWGCQIPDNFKEGIAYAFSPGLTGNSGGDELRRDAEREVREDVRRERPYVWYNVFALAIRPLLKKALDGRQPIEEFLPEAAKAWSRVPEIMKELED